MTISVARRSSAGAHYIGRGSPLGNPFVMRSEADRDRVCDQYEDYFKSKVRQQDPAITQELARLLEMAKVGDVRLGCFCAPKRCHGDTIKAYLEEQLP